MFGDVYTVFVEKAGFVNPLFSVVSCVNIFSLCALCTHVMKMCGQWRNNSMHSPFQLLGSHVSHFPLLDRSTSLQGSDDADGSLRCSDRFCNNSHESSLNAGSAQLRPLN
jgi:hypothetical protein